MSKLNMVSREFLERAAGVRRVGFRTWQVGGRRMRLLRRFWVKEAERRPSTTVVERIPDPEEGEVRFLDVITTGS
jgi:hypothetical protein